MPSYNHEKFISSAIISVLQQDFDDYELLIIDDASKDMSRKIIENFREEDGRIRVIYHRENKGIAKTLNEGIKKATGKFIAFIASDDLWVKEKLDRQIKVLEYDEDLIVWSEGEIIDSDGKSTGKTFTQIYGASDKRKSGRIFEELLEGNFILGSSLIAKKENLRKIEFNDQIKYLNDWQFYVDIAKKYEYYFISAPLVKYRIHGGSTFLDRENYNRDRIMVSKYFLQKYGNEIQNKTKAKIYSNIATAHLQLGNKAKAKQYIYHKIKLNPLDPGILSSFMIYLTNGNDIICEVLKHARSKYRKYKKCLRK
jgi:glycosyltransferase involved in cell wall biosynthesis